MKFSVQDIEQIASRAPNMRANTLLHHLKKLEKAEELKEAQYRHVAGKSAALQQVVDEGRLEPNRSQPFSWFDQLLGRWL